MSSPVKEPPVKRSKGDEDFEDVDESHGLAPRQAGLQESKDATPPEWSEKFKEDLLSGMQSIVQQHLQGLSNDVGELKTKVVAIEGKVDNALNTASEAKNLAESVRSEMAEIKQQPTQQITAAVDEQINAKIKSIQSELKKSTGINSNMLVMGGLKSVSFDAAYEWIEKIVTDVGVPPLSIFMKGTEWKGLIFAKFPNMCDAKTALKAIESKFVKENSSQTQNERFWVNFEQPFEQRVPNSFMFGLCKQLLEWKIENIKIDTDIGIMKWGQKEILKVKVINSMLVLDWLDKDWGSWSELQSSKELAELRDAANQKLSNSKDAQKKGVGKGKSLSTP